MCGRARCTLGPDDVARACHLTGRPVRHVDMDRFRPSYNVSPGFNVPVVRGGDGPTDEAGAVVQCMKWGLVPSFTKKTEKPDHYKMFNARSESIREKASFRRLVPKNRCLVAAEGFYEWKKDGSKKQPFYIHFKDGRPLVFAALYDSWKNSEGDVTYTFTILTTSASTTLEWLHDRMPVIFGDKESAELWLNGPPSSNFDKLLQPYEGSDLAWYPVTPAMGKPSFDGPECVEEIKPKTEDTKRISQFFTKKGDISRSKLNETRVEHDELPKIDEEKPKIDQLKDLEVQIGANKQLLDDVKPESSAPSNNDGKRIKTEEEYSVLSDGPLAKIQGEDVVDQVKGLKEENENQDSKCQHPVTSTDGSIKCDVCTPFLPHGDGTTTESKRKYEEFTGDELLPAAKSDKLELSLKTKKGRGSSGKDLTPQPKDKQPTMFFYFAKS